MPTLQDYKKDITQLKRLMTQLINVGLKKDRDIEEIKKFCYDEINGAVSLYPEDIRQEAIDILRNHIELKIANK
jgi:hypothetical protein